MRRFTTSLLLSLFCLALVACQPAPLKPLPQDAVILALGDSLTEGRTGNGVTYPAVLAQLTGKTVINAGISGETSAGARDRAAQLMARHKPHLVILCTGGNDFLRKDAKKTKENIAAIIQTVQATGAQVVLIAVPRISPFASNYPLYDELASEHDLWIENDVLKTVMHDSALKKDLFHPNGRGYARMAEALADLLKEAGAL